MTNGLMFSLDHPQALQGVAQSGPLYLNYNFFCSLTSIELFGGVFMRLACLSCISAKLFPCHSGPPISLLYEPTLIGNNCALS